MPGADPPCPPSAAQLQARALELWRVARSVEAVEADRLPARAGGDTWTGAAAERCVADLVAVATSLDDACRSLRRRAAELERLALQAPLSAGCR